VGKAKRAHGFLSTRGEKVGTALRRLLPTLRQRWLAYFFTSGHSLSLSGLAASSAGMVATSL